MIKLEIGTGVMDKHNQHPFADNTLHGTRYPDEHGRSWKSPYVLTYGNIARLIAHPTIKEVQIIDDDNREFILTKMGPSPQQAQRIVTVLKGYRNGLSQVIGVLKRRKDSGHDAELAETTARRDELNELIDVMEEFGRVVEVTDT